MNVFIKPKPRRPRDFQFYMQQFTEALARQGFPVNSAIEVGNKPLYNKLLAFIHPAIKPFLRSSQQRAVIVATRGRHLLRDAMPEALHAEIIPMFWDSWPRGWAKQVRAIRQLRCRLCFFTARQAAERLERELPGVKAYWIPEGIDPADFNGERPLAERRYDVYELGRQKADYHPVLAALHRSGRLPAYLANEYDAEGRLLKLAFERTDDLRRALADTKIVISFPASDTHPGQTGGLETLTQRYWEAMLSGCLIVGRAPAELTDLLGYNPVIEVDAQAPAEQLEGILREPARWQALADRNRQAALEHAPWDRRALQIRDILCREGYNCSPPTSASQA